MQCYSLAVIGYRVATFNDCAVAAQELKHVSHVYFVVQLLMHLSHPLLGPDLSNILRLPYDNARIMTTFLGMSHLQNCKIVLASVHN